MAIKLPEEDRKSGDKVGGMKKEEMQGSVKAGVLRY